MRSIILTILRCQGARLGSIWGVKPEIFLVVKLNWSTEGLSFQYQAYQLNYIGPFELSVYKKVQYLSINIKTKGKGDIVANGCANTSVADILNDFAEVS